MSFTNKLPEWKNEGTEPSENLKTNGFTQGYKPPAGIFNWFWSKVPKAITELQNKVVVKGNLLNADLNEALETGIYRFNVPVANKPPITYGQLLVLHGEGDTIAQVAFGYEGKIYYRAGNPVSLGGNGDWTEWQRIYDEKSTVPIAHGGTGATTAAGALSTLGAAAAKHKGQHNRLNGADPVTLSDVAYFGTNPIDFNDESSDTIQNWVDKGSGYCYYSKEGDYGVQPSRYGQLVNLVTGADVFQLWHTLPKGANYIRSGSGSAGWVSGWVKLYDEENKPTPNEIGADGLGAGTNIVSGTDLDSLITLGNYHCISNDVAASLANCPTKTAFTMKVRYGNGTAYYIAQEIVTLFSVTYRRTRNGDSLKWNDWEETYTTTNKPKPSDIGVAPAIESTDYAGCYYRTVGGETEWVNPPMLEGVEYRTTERYNGLPVYTKLKYLGEFAASGSKIKATVISQSDWLIDFEVFAKFKQYNSSSSQKLPIISSDGTLQAYAFMDTSYSIGVQSLGESATYFEGYAIVKYTKADYTV